ncbi:MAG: FumA C-terminus/TtdB family hydratase beta subunit [Methylobacteriaceae bacterium]|jgi:fumarate hydratase subunit beta/L(+)-tartrate dehydratase beta subunit|nr:FumA C-terminus/TtdB family hydratase beta subunit [Methylobacteriaceae bacterium]
MAEHHLTLPVTDADIEKLALGDSVYLDGIVYTARDMAHMEIRALAEKGQPLPEPLAGSAVFHAGPVALKDGDGWRLNVIGPTTSMRMEPYADLIGRLGVKLIIGKGGMFDDSKAAFQRYTQAYLQAAPGCAVQIGAGVRAIKGVHWLENGMPEGMWVLEVKDFGPFIVTMDCRGHSVYDDVRAAGRQAIAAMGY